MIKKFATIGARGALVSSVAGLALMPGAVLAQDNEVAAEEDDNVIVVTARKKSEAVNDLPASVLAVAGEELQESGVVDIELLAVSVPNFSYTTNVGASDNLFIRGLGTVGSGPQFEPAVGQVINGVAFSRSRIGRAGLIDVAQVEVLRGPQGAVTGRNTSLGLVNIVPNKPTDTFEGSIFAGYDFEDNDGFEVEGVLSGPLADFARARVAINYKNKDGHVVNLNPAVGGTSQTKDDFTIRGILDFDLGSSANFEILGQYVDATRDGKPREIAFCNDPAAVLAIIGDDCTLNRTQVNQAIFNGQTILETFDIEMTFLTGTLNWDVADTVTLTSITSYTESTITDVVDTDLSDRARFVIGNAEEFDQFTQELRFSGELAPGLDFILGGIYVDYSIDFIQASDAAFSPNAGRRSQIAQQRNNGWSIFGDLTHELTDTVTVSAGLRYISEDRSARAIQVRTDLFTFDNEVGACGLGSGLFGCRAFPDFPEFAAASVFAPGQDPTLPFSGVPDFADGPFFDDSDDEITWNANLQWRPSDGTMLYASVATGFKAGAFNLLGINLDNTINAQTFSVAPETSTNYELGGRHEFDIGNGAFFFNWTVFQTELEDLQLSSLDPATVTQTVANAGSARSRGVEIDGSLQVDDFTLGYNLAYTDAEYTEFFTGVCYSGQTVQTAPAGGSFALGELGSGQCGPTLINGQVTNVQNRTGTRPTQAPEWQFSVNAQNEFFIGDSMSLTPFVELQYTGEHFTDTELNPISINDDFILLNARITLADDDAGWSLSLVGQNLTNETYIGFFNESGQLDANGLGGGAFAFPNVGRQIALRARFDF